MSRHITTLLVSVVAILALSSTALAKEGATTKFDTLPTDWHAGQTYTLGYTIRMDGVEPYKADRTEIVASSINGTTELRFAGVADGAPGHYVAQVMFPTAGTYRWRVTQGSYFPAYDLGTISVLPAVASAASSSGTAATDALGTPLALAVAAAAALAAIGLVARQRRRPLPAA